MMTQICVAPQPADEVSEASTELANHLDTDAQKSTTTLSEDGAAGHRVVKTILPVEEEAITSVKLTQDSEQQSDPTAPFKFDDEVLAGFRRGCRQDAVSTAGKTQKAGASATQTILEMAGSIQQMKSRLNLKEFGVFVKGLLQWVGDEARKYLDIARAFDGFELSRLQHLEPFTLLKLRSKKYAPIVEQLRSHLDITPKLVQDLVKELLPKPTRKKSTEPISGWKQARPGGGRYYNLLLHDDEQTGLAIEQQAETEGTLPQKIIAEAVALRAKQKSGAVLVSGYRAAQLEEFPIVIEHTRTLEREKRGLELELDKRDRTIAELEAKLTGRALVPIEMCSEELIGLHVEREMESESLDPLRSMGDGLEAQVEQTAEPESTDYSELAPEEDPIQLPEAVEEKGSTAMPQAVEPPEAVQETSCLKPWDEASAADCQLVTPPWDVLKQLRGAEADLWEIDTQIKKLNDKLTDSISGEIVKRELSPVLKKQLNLRSAKISEIVEIINSNSISGYYEEVQNVGRVILDPRYASVALKQAKSWADVVLVVAGDRAQLLKAVDSWTVEQRQVLVHLLSTYLETEPSHLEHVAWIPKTLLQKALTNLSFKIRKIGGPNNLVDDPKIEYVSNCNFVSLEHPGTKREQWIFQDSDNKRHSVFGRDEIEIENC